MLKSFIKLDQARENENSRLKGDLLPHMSIVMTFLLYTFELFSRNLKIRQKNIEHLLCCGMNEHETARIHGLIDHGECEYYYMTTACNGDAIFGLRCEKYPKPIESQSREMDKVRQRKMKAKPYI